MGFFFKFSVSCTKEDINLFVNMIHITDLHALKNVRSYDYISKTNQKLNVIHS